MPCCGPDSAAFSASVTVKGARLPTGLPLIETKADDIFRMRRTTVIFNHDQGPLALTMTDVAGYVSGAFPAGSGPGRLV
jgi:hypothetical protein